MLIINPKIVQTEMISVKIQLKNRGMNQVNALHKLCNFNVNQLPRSDVGLKDHDYLLQNIGLVST